MSFSVKVVRESDTPDRANPAQRHQFPQARYRVSNWAEYDRALPERGSLTVWVTPEAIAAWQPPPTPV
jgi:hypothetical protein